MSSGAPCCNTQCPKYSLTMDSEARDSWALGVSITSPLSFIMMIWVRAGAAATSTVAAAAGIMLVANTIRPDMAAATVLLTRAPWVVRVVLVLLRPLEPVALPSRWMMQEGRLIQENPTTDLHSCLHL